MSNTDTTAFPVFGYELIRDHVLSSILGKHSDDILYWAGKELARKFPCGDIQLIISFFKDAGWGNLSLEKESKDSYIFHLTGDSDILNIINRSFRLEAGFIGEQIQTINGFLTECYEEKKEKQQLITLQVKWDLKEKISVK